jgi:hypothetical protein
MRILWILATFSVSFSNPAAAQPVAEQQAQSDALGNCLVMKSTGEDRLAFAGWMMASMALAPQLNGITIVSPEKRDQLNRQMARIFTRLIAVDCVDVSKPLFKSGNTRAFSSAFEVFGRMAMQELTSNPKEASALEEFTKYINESDFAELKK